MRQNYLCDIDVSRQVQDTLMIANAKGGGYRMAGKDI